MVGPKGAGKTTLLLELAGRLTELGWKTPMVKLDDTWRRQGETLEQKFAQAARSASSPDARRPEINGLGQADPASKTVWFLDGAEQLGFLEWRWALSRTKHADGFVVSSHLPGRLPLLHRCETSAALLAGLVEELLNRSNTIGPMPSEDEMQNLWRRHHGNLRECFRDLYDHHAGRR